MARDYSPIKVVKRFLTGNFGRGVLAPFTGQDSAALEVLAAAASMYCYSDHGGRGAAVTAMACALDGMQREVQAVSAIGIVAIGDWDWLPKLVPLFKLEPRTIVEINRRLASLERPRPPLVIAAATNSAEPDLPVALEIGTRKMSPKEFGRIQPPELEAMGLRRDKALGIASACWSLAAEFREGMFAPPSSHVDEDEASVGGSR